MGQLITVDATTTGDVAVYDTNRSLTGQDGGAFGGPEQAASGRGFGAGLAASIFAADGGVDHIYVASNVVTVRRPGGWDDDAVAAIAEVIRSFFVFYTGGPGDEGGEDGD